MNRKSNNKQIDLHFLKFFIFVNLLEFHFQEKKTSESIWIG